MKERKHVSKKFEYALLVAFLTVGFFALMAVLYNSNQALFGPDSPISQPATSQPSTQPSGTGGSSVLKCPTDPPPGVPPVHRTQYFFSYEWGVITSDPSTRLTPEKCRKQCEQAAEYSSNDPCDQMRREIPDTVCLRRDDGVICTPGTNFQCSSGPVKLISSKYTRDREWREGLKIYTDELCHCDYGASIEFSLTRSCQYPPST